MVYCLKVWRHYLGGRETKVYTDNISLTYFESKAQVTPKELRWYDVIASMNVVLIHKLGRENLVSDALSRKEELMMILAMAQGQNDTPLEREIKEGYKIDEEAIEMNRMFDFRPIPKEGLSSKFPRLKIVKRVNDLLYYKQTRVYIPKGELRTRFMREFHNTPSTGHRGVLITIKELSKEYY